MESVAGIQFVDAESNDEARVFVRANRTFEGDLEVYQVIWGKILQTREGH